MINPIVRPHRLDRAGGQHDELDVAVRSVSSRSGVVSALLDRLAESRDVRAVAPEPEEDQRTAEREEERDGPVQHDEQVDLRASLSRHCAEGELAGSSSAILVYSLLSFGGEGGEEGNAARPDHDLRLLGLVLFMYNFCPIPATGEGETSSRSVERCSSGLYQKVKDRSDRENQSAAVASASNSLSRYCWPARATGTVKNACTL